MEFHAQKQIGKSHVIDIFTSEDMENISLCIFQYLTLDYIINVYICRWETLDSFMQHDVQELCRVVRNNQFATFTFQSWLN